MLNDWKPETFSYAWTPLYLEHYHPDRVLAYKKIEYLMLITKDASNIYLDILDRIRDLALLSTVDTVIAAMKLHPGIAYSASGVVQLKMSGDRLEHNERILSNIPSGAIRSPLLTNFFKTGRSYLHSRVWAYVPYSSMPIVCVGLITERFFKLTQADMQLRPHEQIISWICSEIVSSTHAYNLDANELTRIKDRTRSALVDSYKADPVYSMLLNQAARLILN